MSIHNSQLRIQTTSGTDILDLTPQVTEAVRKTNVQNGTVNLFIPGSTAALTTIEFESGAVNDLREAIERMAPRDLYYEHDERWGDGNGYAHLRSALIGTSLSVPVSGGELVLGKWQQVIFMDFDNRPRNRRIHVNVTGE